jgi:hypothetical protein
MIEYKSCHKEIWSPMLGGTRVVWASPALGESGLLYKSFYTVYRWGVSPPHQDRLSLGVISSCPFAPA